MTRVGLGPTFLPVPDTRKTLIVACPSCRRRYRHEFQPERAPMAHCAACDERFEPAPPRRQYVLVPGGALPGPARVPAPAGMDDPLLEQQLSVSSSPPVTEETPEPQAEAAEPASTSPAVAPKRRFGKSVTAALEAAVAVIPCGIGAGLAYYFAGSLNQDPIISAILGGVTGLLLGWACMLWIAHAD